MVHFRALQRWLGAKVVPWQHGVVPIPRWYGMGWPAADRAAYVMFPIPINVVASLARRVFYAWLVRTKWHVPQNACRECGK